MSSFSPTTGTEAEWNVAYYRLEDYFRALRIENRVHQSQIILRVLEAAAERHAQDPTQNPTVLAMDEARSLTERWFEAILGPREKIEVVGLISLLAADAPAKWPVAFLAEEIPVELQKEMQDSHVKAGPDLQVSSMVPRPIDVTPLLETFHISGALEKIRWGMAFVAVVIVAALTFSVFLLTR